MPGPHIAVAELVPLLPAKAYRPVNVSEDVYWCLTLTVRIPGVGKGRIVVSFEHESLTGRSVVSVPHRVDWSAAKIIHLSVHRWPTETFDQDGQRHLGFNASRMWSAEAIGIYGCLVFVASSRRILHCNVTTHPRPSGPSSSSAKRFRLTMGTDSSSKPSCLDSSTNSAVAGSWRDHLAA